MRVQTLVLSSNAIQEIEDGENVGFKTLVYLRNLDLSNNNIESLYYFKENFLIANLRVANNRIQNLMEVYYLEGKRYLTQ